MQIIFSHKVIGNGETPTSKQITLGEKQHIRNLFVIGSFIPPQSLVRGAS